MSVEAVAAIHQLTVVQLAPEIGQICVANEDGSLQQPPILSTTHHATQYSRDLTRMFMAAGTGEHTLGQIGEQAKYPGSVVSIIASKVLRLVSILPEHVMSYGLSANGSEVVRFGDIAITGRYVSEEDKSQFSDRDTDSHQTNTESAEQETARLDPFKVDLTGYDHVFIKIGDVRLFMQLDSPTTLLAARVLNKLSHYNVGKDGEKITADKFGRELWDSMPFTERLAFVEEDQKFGRGAEFGRKVDAIFDTLTSQRGISRRGGDKEYKIMKSDIELRFGLVPPDDRLPDGVSLLCSPGAVHEINLSAVSDEHITEAANILPLIDQTDITPAGAIRILNVIVKRDGKCALKALLEHSGNDLILAEVINKLDGLARRCLGEEYSSARNSRSAHVKPKPVAQRKTTRRYYVAATTRDWKVVPPDQIVYVN